MKRQLILALALAAGTSAGYCQQPATPAHAVNTPDQVVKRYATQLSLTEEQQSKLKPVVAERQQRMLDLRSDTTSAPRDKMKKMQGIQADADKKISGILTGDQFTKYKAMEAEEREKMRERRAGQSN